MALCKDNAENVATGFLSQPRVSPETMVARSSAVPLFNQLKAVAVSYQDHVRHPEEQACAHDARNGAQFTLQLLGIRDWFHGTVQYVVPVIRDQRLAILGPHCWMTTELLKPSLADG